MNSGCLKPLAIAIMVLGSLLGLLGIIFLLAPGRAMTAGIMLIIGSILIAVALNRLKVMAELSPEGVEQQLTAMATGSNGEITVTSAAGVTHLDDSTIRVALDRLLQQGMVKVEHRQGVEYFIFPGLHEQKMVKKCPYCGNEYPVAQHLRTCPSCGGNLEIRPD
jgi:Zn finger protein HypA/HybF involved in hydrogenase expression